MNINAPESSGSCQGSGKEMNLSSVLIYMKIYSAQSNSIGRAKSIETERREKHELSPRERREALCFGFGGIICMPLFDSWRHPLVFFPFHFLAHNPERLVLVPSPHGSPPLHPAWMLWMGIHWGHGAHSKLGLWEELAQGLMDNRKTRMGNHTPITH